jgi:hypothetical protein
MGNYGNYYSIARMVFDRHDNEEIELQNVN